MAKRHDKITALYFCSMTEPMHATENWFVHWFDSPYYHKLYFERNEQEAAEFIRRLLDHLSPPPGATMLDVACGRGRHARILASTGFDVTGIDLSPNSIAYAKQYEQDHLHFYEHDMRRPFWINYFQYAFNFFTSFGYFRTKREHYAAIRTIAQSLQPRGRFVLDYLNAAYVEPHLVPKEDKTVNGTVFHITRECDEGHIYKNIVIEDKELPAPLEYTERIVKFTTRDLEEMLGYHGLAVKEIFGNYTLDAFNAKTSPRMILLCEKS